MPYWLIVVIVIVILIGAFVFRRREPSELEKLVQEVAELVREGEFAEALPLAQQAVGAAQGEYDQWSENLGSHHSNLMVTGWLADALGQLGDVNWELDNKDEAENDYKQAIGVLEAAITVNEPLDESDDSMPPHPDLPVALAQLGFVLAETGRHEEAVLEYRRSIDVSAEVYEKDSPAIGATLVSMASSLEHLGRIEECETALLRAIALAEPIASESPIFALNLVAALNNLGQLYKRQGREEESVDLLERALQTGERELGEDHPVLKPIRDSS